MHNKLSYVTYIDSYTRYSRGRSLQASSVNQLVCNRDALSLSWTVQLSQPQAAADVLCVYGGA